VSNKREADVESNETEISTSVEAVKNGPLMVYGKLSVKDSKGNHVEKNKVTAFCRCGASSNKPFCDGTHIRIGFSDEE
jgi:CDGSH-type Zn-finger protein